MRLKNFHQLSELDAPVVLQTIELESDQKLTQVYLAERATQKHQSKLRWNSTESTWHCYDYETGMWERVTTESIIKLLIESLSEMRFMEAERIKVSGSLRGSIIKEIERAENSGFLNGAESLMRSKPSMAIKAKDFDDDPYLVGLENGQVLDLRTSSVRPIQQSDYLTKRINTPYIFGATCPLWEKSVLQWTCDDKELAKFLQVWCGYCLSGLTSFQGFLFLYGSGRNGKSVFLNVMSRLLGQYAIAMKSDTLMAKRFAEGGASPDVARLNGARFVTCNELPEGKHFNEELLKSLTGQDTITARFLYQGEFNFVPSLKLMICGNHTPVITGTDNGIWRRVHLVPFEAKINEVDPFLTEKLGEEWAGILNWMIEGWRLFQQEGLIIPQAIKAASAEYKADMDIVAEWLEECVEMLDDSCRSTVSLMDLYKSYQCWCIQNGFRNIPTSKTFSRKLRDTYLGEPTRGSAGNFYRRIRMKDEAVNEDFFKTPMNHRFVKV